MSDERYRSGPNELQGRAPGKYDGGDYKPLPSVSDYSNAVPRPVAEEISKALALARNENDILRDRVENQMALIDGFQKNERQGQIKDKERIVMGENEPLRIIDAEEEAPIGFGSEAFRGEALCQAVTIYGASALDGIRRGKLVIEQVPNRSVLRLRVLGFDGQSARKTAATMLLDEEGFEALKKTFSGYSTDRIEAPAKKSVEMRVQECIEELDLFTAPRLGEQLPAPMREAVSRAVDAYNRALRGEPMTGASANGARRRMDLSEEEKAPYIPVLARTAAEATRAEPATPATDRALAENRAGRELRAAIADDLRANRPDPEKNNIFADGAAQLQGQGTTEF